MNNIKVEGNTVFMNGFKIDFDSSEKVNNFILDCMLSDKTVTIYESWKDVPFHEKPHNQKLDYIIEQLGAIPLEYLDLSVRSFNVLKRAGINDVEDILKLDYDRASRIRNMGRRSLQEIQNTVNEFVKYDIINWVDGNEIIPYVAIEN